MKLVVLESPTKTKTLSRYLSDDYLILSSNGHINELAKTGKYNLGVDLETFQPQFILDVDKANILANLKKYARQATVVYLATDPDREGEAISFHLSNYIKQYLNANSKIQRVVFNEITKSAVLNGFAQPTDLNPDLVESQITRRLLDRMMGFRLTQLLRKKISAKSAGRVQSVALKLIVEREQEITTFKPKKTWNIFALFTNQLEAQLLKQQTKDVQNRTTKLEKVVIRDPKQLLTIKQQLGKEFIIDNIVTKDQVVLPPKPLKTSTLLQLASSKLNFSVKKTMLLAQQLYEGVEIDGTSLGLITYPRTDSERVSSFFFKRVNAFVKTQYGAQFQGKPSNLHKTKQSQFRIQDAHEAIHITENFVDLATAKRCLSSDLYRLYSLIYYYSIASLMAPATFKNVKFHLLNNNYLFELNSDQLVFAGYLQFLHPNQLADFTDFLPPWKVKETITAKEIISKEKVSKPKPRFSEGTLIKNLEKIGVGRPSTYNTIVDKLLASFYIKKEDAKLTPTKVGDLVNRKLGDFFAQLINEKYTCDLEEKLDKIAEGKLTRLNFLSQFWPFLEEKIDIAQKDMKEEKGVKLDKSCPECSHNLAEKTGRYGPFISCTNYPECNYIERKVVKVERSCPKCQSELVEKKGRYGPFISCSGYPECKYIEQKNKLPEAKLDRNCPQCGRHLAEKKGRYGAFISCSGYPECKYIEKSQQPAVKIGRTCSVCKKNDLIEKSGRYGPFISCSGYPQCRYIEQKKG